MSLGFNQIKGQLANIQLNQHALHQEVQRSNLALMGIHNHLSQISEEIRAGAQLIADVVNEAEYQRLINSFNSSMINESFSKLPYLVDIAKDNLRIQNLLLDTKRDQWGNLRNQYGNRI